MTTNGFKLDTRQFSKALKEVYMTSSKTLAQEVNQRTFNTNVRAFDMTPPASSPAPGVQGYRPDRLKIRNELLKELAVTIKLAKTGKNKGKWRTRRKSAYRKFTLANLIVNARRGRAGKKGLWGEKMKAATAKMVGARTRAVGYLKSVFIPVIRGLLPYVTYRKMPRDNMKNIARWPGSAGSGTFDPAKPGWNPRSRISLMLKVRTHEDPKISKLQQTIFQAALDAEAAEMKKHALDMLQKNLSKHNGRK